MPFCRALLLPYQCLESLSLWSSSGRQQALGLSLRPPALLLWKAMSQSHCCPGRSGWIRKRSTLSFQSVTTICEIFWWLHLEYFLGCNSWHTDVLIVLQRLPWFPLNLSAASHVPRPHGGGGQSAKEVTTVPSEVSAHREEPGTQAFGILFTFTTPEARALSKY